MNDTEFLEKTETSMRLDGQTDFDRRSLRLVALASAALIRKGCTWPECQCWEDGEYECDAEEE